MAEPDPERELLQLEGSAPVGDAVLGCPEITARMTDARAADGGCVTVCEAVEGKLFSVWREGRQLLSNGGWLAANPEGRNVLAGLFPAEGIEALVVIPQGYQRLDGRRQLVIIELRIEGRRRPWIELRDAVQWANEARAARVARGACTEESAPTLLLEPVLHRGEAGCSTSEALALLGMAGRLDSLRDPRRVVYWLDTHDGPHAAHAGLAIYLAPLPPMTWKEREFYRQTGLVLPKMTLPEVPVLAPRKGKGSDRLRSDLSAKSKGREPDPRQKNLF